MEDPEPAITPASNAQPEEVPEPAAPAEEVTEQ